MPYPATVFNVMIAAPSDVADEIDIVCQVVHEWNVVHSQDREVVLIPTHWETHSVPAIGDRPQEVINDQVLRSADLLVAIFWTRLGTATGEHPSGTAEEISEHDAAGKPVMLYFSNAPIPPGNVDSQEYDRLMRFKAKWQRAALTRDYENPAAFERTFRSQLAMKVAGDSYFRARLSSTRSTEPIEPVPLSAEAQELLLKVAIDPHGMIHRIPHTVGAVHQVAGKLLSPGLDARAAAKWDAALEKLVARDYLAAPAPGKTGYRLTAAGFEAADRLAAEQSGE